MSATKELKLLAAELPRELWIKEMYNTLQPYFPEKFALGICDDDYPREYIIDIIIEMLNEHNRCTLYDESYYEWRIIDGNLYREFV